MQTQGGTNRKGQHVQELPCPAADCGKKPAKAAPASIRLQQVSFTVAPGRAVPQGQTHRREQVNPAIAQLVQ